MVDEHKEICPNFGSIPPSTSAVPLLIIHNKCVVRDSGIIKQKKSKPRQLKGGI